MSVAALWVQATVIEHQRLSYDQRLQATTRAAAQRWEQRLSDWQRFADRSCAEDPLIQGALRHLSQDRLGPTRRRDLAQRLPALRRSLGFDSLELIDSRTGLDPRVVGTSPESELPAAAVNGLLSAAQRLGTRPFARQSAVPGQPHPLPAGNVALTFSCRASFESAQLRVVSTALVTQESVDQLFGDTSPVTISLHTGEASPGETTDSRPIQVLSDAEGNRVATLAAFVDEGPLRAQIAELQRGFVGAGALAALFALILGLVMAGRVTGPLRDLEAATARVGEGDFDAEIAVRHGGEIGAALSAFNEMTRTLRSTRARMLRAERVAAWREIARRIAHEIKNPLSPIQVSIETMRKTKAKRHPDFDEIFEESTVAILEEVERLKRIVLEFSRFARLPRPRLEALQVIEILDHLEHLHAIEEVELRREVIDATPSLRADREQLTQALLNLLQNARDAASAHHGETGGEVLVRIESLEDEVQIEILDNGAGIPEEKQERVFEPYFTTKTKGTGLGLAVVLRIIEEHQGSIELIDGLDGGAGFRMRLPIAGPEPLQPATETDGLA